MINYNLKFNVFRMIYRDTLLSARWCRSNRIPSENWQWQRKTTSVCRCALVLTQAETNQNSRYWHLTNSNSRGFQTDKLLQPPGPEASLILLHGPAYGVQRMTTVTIMSAEYKEYDEQRVLDFVRIFFSMDSCWLNLPPPSFLLGC